MSQENLASQTHQASPLVQNFLEMENLFQNIVERSRQVDRTVQSAVELAELTVVSCVQYHQASSLLTSYLRIRLNAARDTVVEEQKNNNKSKTAETLIPHNCEVSEI